MSSTISRKNRNQRKADALKAADANVLPAALLKRLVAADLVLHHHPFGGKKIAVTSEARESLASLIEHLAHQRVSKVVKLGKRLGVATLTGEMLEMEV